MTEGSCATTFVITPKLRWADDPLDPKEAGECEMASIYASGFRTDHQVLSISSLGATLRGNLPSAAGTEVTVELANGRRSAGTIAWTQGSSFGVGFKQPIDVLALIKRKLVSQPVERRSMPRIEVRCTAWLKTEEEFSAVFVRNISARGLQLEGEDLPGIGTEVSLYLEGLNIPPGELIWRRDNLAGVRLRHDLSWVLIMPWLRNLVQNTP